MKVAGVLVAGVTVAAVCLQGRQWLQRRRWAQGRRRRALMVSGLEQCTPGQLWTGWGVFGRARTRGAHKGQWVGDGGHGLTEPEPKPKERWSGGSGGYVQSDGRRQWWGWRWWAGNGGMAGLEQCTPGQYGPVEGCVDEPGPETRGAHQGQWVGDGGHGLTEPEPEPERAMVRQQRRMSRAMGGCCCCGSSCCRGGGVAAAMVAWQGSCRSTPGHYGPGEGCARVGRRWLQGGGGCRGGDGCQSAMVVEWSRSRSNPGLSWPVERCGQSGRRLGKGCVGEVEGKGMGGRGGEGRRGCV